MPSNIICKLRHRPHWKFVARQMTGPSMLTRQRHIGIYHCERCGLTHRIVTDNVRQEDSRLALDAPPPARGPNMALHALLGGPL